MSTYRNVGVHPVDLSDGRILAPGEVVETDADPRDEHFSALIEDGLLAEEEPKEPQERVTPKSRSKRTEGEEE